MYGDTEQQWSDLRILVGEVVSTEHKDKVIWTLTGNSKFVVKELYWHLKACVVVGYRFI